MLIDYKVLNPNFFRITMLLILIIEVVLFCMLAGTKIGIGMIALLVTMLIVVTTNFILIERHQISKELNQSIRDGVQVFSIISWSLIVWVIWKRKQKPGEQ